VAGVPRLSCIVVASLLAIAPACVGTEVDARPDAAAGTDAGSDLDAIQTGPCTRTWIDLLDNGSFDDGAVGWSSATNGGDIVREEGAGYPWSTHTGTWGALLLGFNDGAQQLMQTVTVPESATRLRLQAYRCYVTEEVMDAVFDTLSIELQSGAATRETLAEIDNTDAAATCNWRFLLAETDNPLAGETVELVFTAASDGASVTSFGFDTISLEALACP
jgi:hypothetical protein